MSDGDFHQVSFVNSICTTLGGTHVNYLADQIAGHVQGILKKKHKKEIKPNQIKANLWIFVNCQITNPAFDSQTKDTLTTKPVKFGSSCILSNKFLSGIADTGIVETVVKIAGAKEEAKLKRLGGGKKKRVIGIEKLDDANMAGRKGSERCTLIVTEGDSAKSLADAGLAEIGRDYYGVFPLRGKFLNVRDANTKQIMANKEIQNLLQIIGLKIGTKYEDKKGLRYGSLMVMADQDHDGSHIKGLIINFIHKFWPSLVRMNSFVKEFATPIIKARKGTQTLTFFTQQEYDIWKRRIGKSLKSWNIKYYKGLGTSDNEEAKEYFSDLPTHTIEFKYEGEEDDQQIELAFSKTQADQRKEWLNTYDENIFVDHSLSHVTYKDFINKELIGFSRANCIRAIPSICDGFKPGQRKILFACFKRNLTTEIKVAQLSGYVAEKSAYHHGEQSLASTIVGMAQNFVGSNNISYLEPKGQFGTRAMGGKDAASARYIYTRLTPISKLIFHKHDRFLLKYLSEEGQSIEPEYYIPVIPTVLVNGAEGIGTGWSTFIPCFNPVEIINALRDKMDGKDFERLTPWYKHYKGAIAYDRNSYAVSGKFELDHEEQKLKITELPIRKWTRDYKKFLESFMEKDIITDMREYHATNQVDFEVFYDKPDKYFEDDEVVSRQFKLTTTLSDNNYVLFDKNNKLRKYADETEILEEFYEVRLDLYEKRKDYMVRKLLRDLEILENKAKFIAEVISEEVVVKNRKKKELLKTLRLREYSKYSDIMNKVPEENAQQNEIKLPEDENEEELKLAEGIDEEEIIDLASDYNYLLNMAIWSLTEEKIKELNRQKEQKEEELVNLKKVTIYDLWRQDLDEIENELLNIEKKEITVMQKTKEKMEKAKKPAKGKKKKKKSEKVEEEVAKLKVKKKAPPPPKKSKTKQKDIEKSTKAKGDGGKKTFKNKDTASEESGDTTNLDDLPLVERMRLKMKMRNEEKKGSFEPEVNPNLYGKSDKMRDAANGIGSRRKVIYSDEESDEEEVPPPKAVRGTRPRAAASRRNYEDVSMDDESDTEFEI